MAEKQVQFYYLLRIIQNLSKVKHNLLTDYVISLWLQLHSMCKCILYIYISRLPLLLILPGT